MARYAVIPTNGRECVDMAIAAMLHQVDRLAVVESGPSVTSRRYPAEVTHLFGGTELNISRWWNVGLDWAEAEATAAGHSTWDVAVINDDVIVPPAWFCYVADDLRALGCVAGCSGGRHGTPQIQRQAGPVGLFDRLQGFAFVLAGESGLRADEEMAWWYGDDDLGARAAAAGGMVMMPGCHVQHLYPNAQTTDAQQPQIALDRATFIRKRGFVPW